MSRPNWWVYHTHTHTPKNKTKQTNKTKNKTKRNKQKQKTKTKNKTKQKKKLQDAPLTQLFQLRLPFLKGAPFHTFFIVGCKILITITMHSKNWWNQNYLGAPSIRAEGELLICKIYWDVLPNLVDFTQKVCKHTPKKSRNMGQIGSQMLAVDPFWQSVDSILEDVPVIEIYQYQINLKTIIFQCSKNDGSPTRVTRLKVAPNMVDSISLNEKRP